MLDLKLFTGPRLERQRWVHDEVMRASTRQSEDVTDSAHEYLFDKVDIAPDVTLSDIFALVGPSPVLQAVYRQQFVADMCEEASKGPSDPREESWERLDYLELYQAWELDTSCQQYEGIGRWHLQGRGVVHPADIVQEGRVVHTKGERIERSVYLAPLRQLLHLPVRLSADVQICESDPDANACGKPIAQASNPHITLGAFIRETLWALSFFGSPAQSVDFGDALKEELEEELDENEDDVDAIERGERPAAKTYSSEEFSVFLGVVPPESVYDQFFEDWRCVTASKLYHALHALKDTAPVGRGLRKALDKGIVVKPRFAGLPSRKFRKLVRLANHKTP